MKRFRWFIGIGVLVIAGLIMLTASFHFARSETSTSTSLSRASSYHTGPKKRLDLDRVCLHEQKRVGLGSALAWEICQRLAESGNLQVLLVNNDPESDDYPLLLVDIRDEHILWTPFYGRATFRVVVAYASYTSDIKLEDTAPISFDGSEDEGDLPLRVRGDVKITNTAIGLLTRPGYRRMLAAPAAQAVADYLVESIDAAKKTAAEKASTTKSKDNEAS